MSTKNHSKRKMRRAMAELGQAAMLGQAESWGNMAGIERSVLVIKCDLCGRVLMSSEMPGNPEVKVPVLCLLCLLDESNKRHPLRAGATVA